MKNSILLFIIILLTSSSLRAQQAEKIVFDANDAQSGYYLAIPPLSKKTEATLVIFTGFYNLEALLAETRLHNVAYGNNIMTIFASTKESIYADSAAIRRINTILGHATTRFGIDTSKLAFAAFDIPGNMIFRYAELSYEHPAQFPFRPKAILGIDCTMDLTGLWHWCEREIAKDYDQNDVGTAKYVLDILNREIGTLDKNPDGYRKLSPFQRELSTAGNEKFLCSIPVRLYYDTDISWQLKNRRNSFYDTNIPDGSEFISRLLLAGNTKAEFITAERPGIKINGLRRPTSFSIVDEVECVDWLKKNLGVFDPETWIPPYHLPVSKWQTERIAFPIDFAPGITYKGVEDLRFYPGWGDADSPEYWSYAFLWWLDGEVTLNDKILSENLTAYYTGLVGRNIKSRNIPAEKVVPTVASVKKTQTAAGDQQTYNATIGMLDYMTQKPIQLNGIIHIRNCDKTHTAILIEISPKKFDDAIWKPLEQLQNDFSCKN